MPFGAVSRFPPLKRGRKAWRCVREPSCRLKLALDAALEKLDAEFPVQAQLVKLRYFGGLSHQEAAQALGISRATADRYWAFARAFLYSEIEDAEDS